MIAVYPRCIRADLGRSGGDVEEFERELRRELGEAEQACASSGEVWLGDVRLGAIPLVTRSGHRVVLVARSGTSVKCHSLETVPVTIEAKEVTNLLVRMFFEDVKSSVWRWAQGCLRKLGGGGGGIVNLGWRQALFGEPCQWKNGGGGGRVQEEAWRLLRRCILVEIWWMYNRSLVEDTSRFTTRQLVHQAWLSLRLYILLDWTQVVKAQLDGGSGAKLQEDFERRWLANGFAGMRAGDRVLWLWEEPLLLSSLSSPPSSGSLRPSPYPQHRHRR